MSWPAYKLGEIAEVIRGVTFSKADGSDFPEKGRIPVIRAGSIQKSLLIDEGQIWVSDKKVKKHQLIKQHDIIMCTSSGSADLVGKCAISEGDYNVSFGAFCAGIRANIERVSPLYLYHFLCSPSFKNWTKNSSGANIKNIRVSELADFEIPLPPLPEQKRIASILDKADAIRRKRQQAIDLADEFLRAVFLDMFGDPVMNPKGWDISRLPSHGTFKNGLNFSKEDSGISLRYLGVGDFKSLTTITDMQSLGRVELNECPAKDYLLKNGDLVFVRSNGNKALVGRCISVYPDDEALTFSGFCIRYRVEDSEIEPEYLNYLLRTPSMKRAMLKGGQGANIQNINQKILSSLSLPLPPLQHQQVFCEVVKKFRKTMHRIVNNKVEADTLFGSLSQKAFSGML